MFSGWFKEYIQEREQKAIEEKKAQEKWQKENPKKYKLEKAWNKTVNFILMIVGVSWVTWLPILGIYTLVKGFF